MPNKGRTNMAYARLYTLSHSRNLHRIGFLPSRSVPASGNDNKWYVLAVWLPFAFGIRVWEQLSGLLVSTDCDCQRWNVCCTICPPSSAYAKKGSRKGVLVLVEGKFETKKKNPEFHEPENKKQTTSTASCNVCLRRQLHQRNPLALGCRLVTVHFHGEARAPGSDEVYGINLAQEPFPPSSRPTDPSIIP